MINVRKNRFLIVMQSNIGRAMERRVQMRKRKWRKLLLGMMLGAFLIVQMTMPVCADDTDIYVDGSWLTEAQEATTEDLFDFTVETEDENTPVPFTSYLYGGKATISNVGGGKVNMFANTKAAVVCDTIKVDIYLQYYSNGAWNYVNNFNYTLKNESYIGVSRTVSVTKGRYYRIKCYHEITKNGVRERCTSATDGIKIN